MSEQHSPESVTEKSSYEIALEEYFDTILKRNISGESIDLLSEEFKTQIPGDLVYQSYVNSLQDKRFPAKEPRQQAPMSKDRYLDLYGSVRQLNALTSFNLIGDYVAAATTDAELIDRLQLYKPLADEHRYFRLKIFKDITSIFLHHLEDIEDKTNINVLFEEYIRLNKIPKQDIKAEYAIRKMLVNVVTEERPLKTYAFSKAKSYEDAAQELGIDTSSRNTYTFALKALQEFYPDYFKRSRKKSIYSFSHAPVTLENAESFSVLEAELLTNPPKGVAKLVETGITMTMNLANAITGKTEDTKDEQSRKDNNARKFLTLHRQLRSKIDGSAYSKLISLGNVIGQAISAKNPMLENLAPLPTHTVASLPESIQKIQYFLLSDQIDTVDDDILELYTTVQRCATLLIETGIERKLKQRTVSLGDIAIRFGHLPASDVRDILEEAQRRPAGPQNHVVAIYHDLRAGKHKNHTKYEKNRPGYGLFT